MLTKDDNKVLGLGVRSHENVPAIESRQAFRYGTTMPQRRRLGRVARTVRFQNKIAIRLFQFEKIHYKTTKQFEVLQTMCLF